MIKQRQRQLLKAVGGTRKSSCANRGDVGSKATYCSHPPVSQAKKRATGKCAANGKERESYDVIQVAGAVNNTMNLHSPAPDDVEDKVGFYDEDAIT